MLCWRVVTLLSICAAFSVLQYFLLKFFSADTDENNKNWCLGFFAGMVGAHLAYLF